jgi:hypothetical protein
MSHAMIICTWAKRHCLIESGAGCDESRTSGSNREGRWIILALDSNSEKATVGLLESKVTCDALGLQAGEA